LLGGRRLHLAWRLLGGSALRGGLGGRWSALSLGRDTGGRRSGRGLTDYLGAHSLGLRRALGARSRSKSGEEPCLRSGVHIR